MRFWNFAGFILALALLISCNNDDDLKCVNNYDQSVLLTNLADNVIIPDYQKLDESMDSLTLELSRFKNDPDITRLLQVRSAFSSAYLDFQNVSQYQFGPAELVSFRSAFNNFPLNTEELKENISSGVYVLDDIERYDKGFPSLDYILYGVGASPSEIVDFLMANGEYIDYAEEVVQHMVEKLDFVLSEWRVEYRDQFIENQGTNAGASLSLIVNNLNENYEISKRDRLGIPSGELTLNFPNPDLVEAPHSQLSLDLLKVSIRATIDFYLGRTDDGTNGEGLDDLLEFIGAEKDGRSLNEIIQEQYDVILQTIDEIDGPLSIAVEQDSDDVIEAYAEISRQVINTKTDMSSVMCITITYVDAPSDTD
ncbi:MAG: imelysin family protein [Saprospiraceae bacterium]|nr:imelysin family protein [Saprospiraceae bacterium]